MVGSFSNLWRYGLGGRSLRTYLVLLVLAATLPLALFAGLVFWWNSRLDNAAMERDMRDMARLLKIAVEREVGTSLAVLETIATSPHLDTGDLKSFHELVSRAAESREGTSFALFERGGRQLLNTRRPFAAPLPSAGQSSDPAAMHASVRLGSPETIEKVFETARPAVSDLFESQLTRRPALGLIVPVVRNGQVRYALGMAMQPETFNRLLQDPSLPATWHSVILDRRGVIIARKYDAEKYIGRSAPAQMVGLLPNAEEGWGPGRTLDGLDLYRAFTRSQLTGWTVMIGAPESALGIETQRSAGMMTTGGAVLVLIALGLAVALGRRIAAPIFGLAASAEAIQRGQQLDLPPAGVRELDHLRSALLEAGAHARASTQERERRMIAEAKQEEAEVARQKIAESEALLREREQQLQVITDATPALISYIDREQRYRFVNREYERWFGYSRADVVGKTMTEVLGELAMERLRPHVDRVLRGGDVRFELETPYREGGTRWIDAHYVPDRSVSGEVAGFFVLVLDITERKRTEKALAETLRRQQVLYRFLERRHETRSVKEIFEAALDAIIAALRCHRASILLLDSAEVMRFIAWRGLSRQYRDAVDGHTAWQPDDPDPKVLCVDDVGRADLDESLKAVVTREGLHALAFIPLVLEGRLIGKFMAYFNEPHHFTAQEIELSVAIARQIALAVRRFRIEEALRESEESYRAVVETQAEMICRFRTDGQIVFVNGAYARARSTTVEALVGQSFWGFIDAQDRTAVEAMLAKLTPESPEVRIENRFETSAGVRWTLWTNRAVAFDDQGRWTLAQSTGIDITDRKQAEEEIQRLNAELEERVEQRTRQLSEMNSELEAFSYSISHDLRAPLRAMEGYARALADDYGHRLDRQGRDWLERISRSAHRLDTLISDVLAYSRVAKEAVALAPVDLERLIEDIQGSHPEFQPPRAQITIEKPLHRVVGHEAYLTQSITNVLGNAVKFVEDGVIPKVSVRSEQRDGRVRIWFRDNGIGIDPSHQERIFQIFGQVHPNGRYAGTGIGLAIVRKAVQRMNGEIGVQSEPGKGSAFWLLLQGVKDET